MKTIYYLFTLLLLFNAQAQTNAWTKDDRQFMYQLCRNVVDTKYPTPNENDFFLTEDVKLFIDLKVKTCNCMVDQVVKTILRSTYNEWMEQEQQSFVENRSSDCLNTYSITLFALQNKSINKEAEVKQEKEQQAKLLMPEYDFIGIWTCALPNFLIKQNSKGEREILKDGLGLGINYKFFDVILREDGSTEVPFLYDAAGNNKPAEGRIKGTWTFDEETKTLTFTTFESKKGVILNSGLRHDKKFNIEYYRPGYIKMKSLDDFDKTGPINFQLTKQKAK